MVVIFFLFLNGPAATEIYTLSLHDALPICQASCSGSRTSGSTSTRSPSEPGSSAPLRAMPYTRARSEEHTSELQSQSNLVCRLLPEKKKGADHAADPKGDLRLWVLEPLSDE